MKISGRWSAVSPVVLVASAVLTATVLSGPAQAATAPVAHGVVTAADGSGPIAGITVCAIHRYSDGGYGSRRCAETGADGTFSIAVTQNLYSINAEEQDLYGTWVAQDYNHSKAYSFATSPNRTFNFALVRGAKISGVLHDPDGGAPAHDSLGVEAYPVDANGHTGGYINLFSNIGTDGYFEVSKIPPGTYKLLVTDHYKPAVYAQQWYPDSTAASGGTAITVTAGQRVTGRDMTLTPPGSMTVSLRNPKGLPTSGLIEIFDADGRAVGNDGPPATTMTFDALHPGSYKVRAWPLNVAGYREWYAGKRTFATANTVTVVAGATASKTLTFHYPTMTVTRRPTIRLKGNVVVSTHATWKVKPSHVRFEWIRDGKVVDPDWLDHLITKKGDVGHRFKVCQIAHRTAYADRTICTGYSEKVTTY